MIKNEFFLRILSSVLLISFALFFIIKGSYFFIFFMLVSLLISLYEWHKLSKKKYYEILGYIFLFISFYSAYLIKRDFDTIYSYFLLIALICVLTDIGGYIFGKVFKGPKLTKISPNKTFSGMIGGYVLSTIFITIYFNNYNFSIFDNLENQNLNNFIFIFTISTISQIGDIFISYFKRKSKIKDTGKIIPGHGGLLDRIDGMIFAFPSAYLIFIIVN